jgi:hypothetical protein
MSKSMSKRTLIILSLLLISLGVVERFMPHTWNFTPVTAIALAAGAYIGGRYALGVVIAIMALSDISLGFYEWQIMLAVYVSFAVSACIGVYIKKHRTFLTVTAGSVAASLLFFVVTNLAVWKFSGMYPQTLAGLEMCFIAALPFFRGTFVGDLFFSGFFFGVFEMVKKLAPEPQTSRVSL